MTDSSDRQPEDSNYLVVKDPKEIFHNDVSLEVAKPWIDQMVHQSALSFTSNVDTVAWENGLVPCTYLMCERDRGVYFWLQEQMFEAVSKESGKAWTVEEV